MAGETNRLFKLASELSEAPNARETDVLVATGEQVSAALLAIRLKAMGHPTVVSRISVETRDRLESRPRANQIGRCDRLSSVLEGGKIAVVAGYQGVDPAAISRRSGAARRT